MERKNAIILMGLMLIILTPMVSGEDIEILYEVIADVDMRSLVDFGSLSVNDVKTELLFTVETPAVNDSINVTILHYSGLADANYKIFAPAGSKDDWANGKIIEKNTKYTLPVDKIGNYYLEIAPISIGNRNMSVVVEPSPFLNITRS